MNYIELVLSTLAGGGIAVVTIKFLSEKLLNQLLTKEIEKYKSELSERTEALKSKMSIFAHEQNIVTSRVDEQKSQAIHHVYAAITDVTKASTKIAMGYPVMNGAVDDELSYYHTFSESAHEAGRILSDTLSAYAIYFTGSTYGKVAEVAHEAMLYNAKFLTPIRKGLANEVPPEKLISEIRGLQEAYESNYSKEMNYKVREIVDLFRVELGIEKT